jgi:hypothetical protein
MTHTLAPCQQATIIDTEAGTIHTYRDLPVRPEHPGVYPKSQHATARAYLIYWPGGVVAHLFTRQGLHQIQPATIDALYRAAKRLPPLNERGRA